jgi:hypothetical protein
MPEKKENEEPKRRTLIKDLPQEEEESLTPEQQKQVRGGARGLAVGVRIVGSGLATSQEPQE